MTALFIITLLLLAVSLFYNCYFWRLAKLWRSAYHREIRGAAAEKIGFIIGYVGMNFLISWLTRKKGE